MPSKYIVLDGDTYDTVARKVYGDDQQSGRIRRANPGAADPIIAGTSLVIPDDAPTSDAGNRTASSPNEVALRVSGKRFRFWSSVTITLAVDAVPTVDFTAPFEPDDIDFRDTFRPFSYQAVDIDVGGDRLFTGTLVGVDPSTIPESRTVGASCYALPGVMGDCTAPASAYPLEWDQANLRVIAEKVAEYFGISVVFEADAGTTFERVSLAPGEDILQWLAGLSAQRGLVISATAEGALLFLKGATDSTPVADITEGKSPVESVSPAFSPQKYFSSITGITPMLVGLPGPQYTEKNKHLPGAIRPHTFISDNTLGSDLAESVRSKMGRMFANVVGYDVPVSTWRDPSGALWAPNTLITLDAPGAMIYGRSTFLIRSVILQKTSGSETATLNLILPSAFAGVVPERLPWDE